MPFSIAIFQFFHLFLPFKNRHLSRTGGYYAENLMTISRHGVTKHYFAETERILANVFTGGTPLVPTNTMLKPVKYNNATVFSEKFTTFATEYFVRNANYEECKENKIPCGNT
jgi:hypothetical protein